MKLIILSLIFITFTYAQIVTFESLQLDQSPPQNPSSPSKKQQSQQTPTNGQPKIENCLEEENGECLACSENYEIGLNKQCEIMSVENDFIPCEGKPYCGQTNQISQDRFKNITKQFSAPVNSLDSNQVSLDPSSNQKPSIQNDFSSTNNQQENVDEADLLKTDGTYIYTISNSKLNIILAYPYQNLKIVSYIQLSARPQALFIEENKLALFGITFQNSLPFTFVLIYDITNRGVPVKEREYLFEGTYFDGRKTRDGYVYLLSTLPIRPLVTPRYDVGEGLNEIPLSSVFVHQDSYAKPLYINIISFDLRVPNPAKTKMITIITESVHKVYMTSNHIYFTYPKKINSLSYTVIHKIFVWKTYIIPFADATVLGSINNQFDLDEFGGFILRVAVTSQYPGLTTISVYAMNYFLKGIGTLQHILLGFSIRSTRYVERKLYIGTNLGPFVVISFRSHFSPFIAGSLPLRGFSRYLFPYNDDFIFSFGRSHSDNTGLKIWVISVENPLSPKEVGSFELDEKYAGSSAQFEHKAFLLSTKKNIMVIPLRLSPRKFNGALFLKIVVGQNDEKWIFTPFLVNHLEQGDRFSLRTVQRSLYIEDYVYTKSKCLLKVNFLAELTTHKVLPLQC